MWSNKKQANITTILVALSASHYTQPEVLAKLRECDIVHTSNANAMPVLQRLLDYDIELVMLKQDLKLEELEAALKAAGVIDENDRCVDHLNFHDVMELTGYGRTALKQEVHKELVAMYRAADAATKEINEQ